MRKSKNRYFYHIFASPGDAPGAITLNVVWMERESDAYKLSSCMWPSKYNRFWDTARYLWKNRHFIIPLAFDDPVWGVPVGISAPLWYGNTRMVSLPDGEKISKIRLFVLTWSTNVTDRRTLHNSKDRAYASHRAVKKDSEVQYATLNLYIKIRSDRRLTVRQVMSGTPKKPQEDNGTLKKRWNLSDIAR